ncbi:Replication factor C large subunit [Pyrodictium delaneyi]|uniref:Replication factor C large subunit n=1 Tax=Pyrodictium delaneyi TaxID=1273541 RepID=A0A0P0N5A2_9CREN|nr:replication factor C large subunit [Pyrodictium delaneyi]ALL01683.1 Replication factor C large subunit [Pyrodictium delaneyi]OWJ55087.1 replication factor C large subunit [Pyrodictium delaneyi]
MVTRNLPWIIKYRPRRVEDVVDQEQAKEKFIPWLRQWLRGRPPEKKAALFYGPAGVGKTSLVEAAAHEYGLELIEMNASDFRRREDIERIAKVAATQYSLFGRKRIILLDEVDGISGTADRGGLDAILDLINVTRHPIVMTANDPWDQKLRPLREAALMIPFNRLSERHVVQALKRICIAEGIECEDAALKLIAQRAEGDLRSAINDLQAIAEGYGRVTVDIVRGVLTSRDRQYSPWEMLRHLFMSKYAWQAKRAVTHADLDYDTMLQWLNENIAIQYSDPEDIWRAHESLARADIFMGRIRRTQSWDLLSYVFDLAGPGIALARKKSKFKWAKYQFPQKILLLARTKETREVRDAIAEVLAKRLHISKARAKSEIIPFLSMIFRERPDYAARIAIGYNLTDSMIKYLAGPVYNQVKEHINMLLLRLERAASAPARTKTAANKSVQHASVAASTSSSSSVKRKSTRRTSSRRRRKGGGTQTTLPI